jgi:hypothetical protein
MKMPNLKRFAVYHHTEPDSRRTDRCGLGSRRRQPLRSEGTCAYTGFENTFEGNALGFPAGRNQRDLRPVAGTARRFTSRATTPLAVLCSEREVWKQRRARSMGARATGNATQRRPRKNRRGRASPQRSRQRPCTGNTGRSRQVDQDSMPSRRRFGSLHRRPSPRNPVHRTGASLCQGLSFCGLQFRPTASDGRASWSCRTVRDRGVQIEHRRRNRSGS